MHSKAASSEGTAALPAAWERTQRTHARPRGARASFGGGQNDPNGPRRRAAVPATDIYPPASGKRERGRRAQTGPENAPLQDRGGQAFGGGARDNADNPAKVRQGPRETATPPRGDSQPNWLARGARRGTTANSQQNNRCEVGCGAPGQRAPTGEPSEDQRPRITAPERP